MIGRSTGVVGVKWPLLALLGFGILAPLGQPRDGVALGGVEPSPKEGSSPQRGEAREAGQPRRGDEPSAMRQQDSNPDPGKGAPFARKSHTSGVVCLAFSADGKSLASGSVFDSTVRIWDPATGACKVVLRRHVGPINSVAFSPDGKSLASGSDDTAVIVWDLAKRAPRAILRGNDERVWCVAFSPDGSKLASGSNGTTMRGADDHITSSDDTVRLWEVSSGKKLATLRTHQDCGDSVAFDPGGKLLASTGGGSDGTVRLWDVETLKERVCLRIDQPAYQAFSPDGKTLVAGGVEREVMKLWNVKSGKELRVSEACVYGVAFAPDGKSFATGSEDGSVRLWDPGTGKVLATLRGSSLSVRALAFSPDGKTLAVANGGDKAGGRITLWDPATGKERLRIEAKRDDSP